MHSHARKQKILVVAHDTGTYHICLAFINQDIPCSRTHCILGYATSYTCLFISPKKPGWRNVGFNKSGQLFVLVLCINELFALDLEFKTVINMKQLASSLIQECQSPCSL